MLTNMRRVLGLAALGGVMALIAAALLIGGGDGVGASSPDAGSVVLKRVAIPEEYVEQCSNGVVVLFPENNPGLVADCAVLLAAKDAIEGEEGFGLDWSTGRSILDWTAVGVELIEDGATYRVTILDFDDYSGYRNRNRRISMRGRLPSEIGNLRFLRKISLKNDVGSSGYHKMGGSIPSSWGNLGHLRILDMRNNVIGAIIPSSFGGLRDLEQLHLQGNQIEGQMPSALGNLDKLEILDISNNQLTGSIPRSFGDLAKLRRLSLNNNQLGGGIPGSMGDLRELEELYLNNNALSGTIPATFGGMLSLRTLDLRFNQLAGGIPYELGRLRELRRLLLGGNRFSGCIPEILRPLLNSYELTVGIGLPFCDDDPTPTPTATGTPAPTPTTTPTPEPGATITPTPTPSATPVGGAAPGYGDLFTMITNLSRRISELSQRMAAIERNLAYTPTPTATPDPVYQPAPMATATPEMGSATMTPTPTMTPEPTATRAPEGSYAHCIEAIERSGILRGAWTGECETANAPDNQTYFSRYFAFRLLGPGTVTLALYSRDVKPYLYLLKGEGLWGEVIKEQGDKYLHIAEMSVDLRPGHYTIEASTYNSGDIGDFELDFEVNR